MLNDSRVPLWILAGLMTVLVAMGGWIFSGIRDDFQFMRDDFTSLKSSVLRIEERLILLPSLDIRLNLLSATQSKIEARLRAHEQSPQHRDHAHPPR